MAKRTRKWTQVRHKLPKKKKHFGADLRAHLTRKTIQRPTCVNLHWVAKRWKTCLRLRANLRSINLSASYRKPSISKAHARLGQTESQVIASFIQGAPPYGSGMVWREEHDARVSRLSHSLSHACLVAPASPILQDVVKLQINSESLEFTNLYFISHSDFKAYSQNAICQVSVHKQSKSALLKGILIIHNYLWDQTDLLTSSLSSTSSFSKTINRLLFLCFYPQSTKPSNMSVALNTRQSVPPFPSIRVYNTLFSH